MAHRTRSESEWDQSERKMEVQQKAKLTAQVQPDVTLGLRIPANENSSCIPFPFDPVDTCAGHLEKKQAGKSEERRVNSMHTYAREEALANKTYTDRERRIYVAIYSLAPITEQKFSHEKNIYIYLELVLDVTVTTVDQTHTIVDETPTTGDETHNSG